MRLKGWDGKRNFCIERMRLLWGYDEAVVAMRASSTNLEMTAMVRVVAAVMSASSSPHGGVVSREGAVSAAGGDVMLALAMDQIRTQAVSAVEVGTSVRVVTCSGSGSAVTVAVAAGEDGLEIVV